MKKRGVSPVIATVLLIALVTAAAAIVFLVVIPMLQPPPEAIVKSVTYNDLGDGNFSVAITILAQGADMVFNGTVEANPTVVYLVVDSTTPLSITNGVQKIITIIGSFTAGEAYSLTLSFLAGNNDVTGIANFSPVAA